MAKDYSYYFSQLRRIEDHREEKAEKEIRKIYKGLLKETRQFIAEEYYTLAEDGKLTYDILRSKGQDARFLQEIERRLTDISLDVSSQITKTVEEMYQLAYDGIRDAVQKGGDTAKFFEGVDTATAQMMYATVDNTIMDVALEKNHKENIWNIKREVATALTVGDRFDTMAQRLTNTLNGNYKKAILIARTEVGRVREAGHLASAKELNSALEKGSSGLRMVKKWKTMDDERVRPNHWYRTKSGMKKSKRKGAADHVRMNNKIVLMEEPFVFSDGVQTQAPKQSGVARHDCNCRCTVLYPMVDDEEFFKATGRHFDGSTTKTVANAENSDIMEAETISDEVMQIVYDLEDHGIGFNPVSVHSSMLTENEIIQLIGGGDKTSGSCASVALAYAGQRCGFNVLDFRGGNSMDWFSSKFNKQQLFKALGAKTLTESSGASNLTNGKRVLQKLVAGKEYYLSVGRHAAIVRKTEDGVLQYLELQSPWRNGWTDFGDDLGAMLKHRFGCSSSSRYFSTAYATDISQFGGSDFRKITGYINTDPNSQKKGVSGRVR